MGLVGGSGTAYGDPLYSSPHHEVECSCSISLRVFWESLNRLTEKNILLNGRRRSLVRTRAYHESVIFAPTLFLPGWRIFFVPLGMLIFCSFLTFDTLRCHSLCNEKTTFVFLFLLFYCTRDLRTGGLKKIRLWCERQLYMLCVRRPRAHPTAAVQTCVQLASQFRQIESVSCANSGRGIQGLQLMVTRQGIENSKKSISCDISAGRGGDATTKAGLRQIRLYCDTI